MKMKREMKKYSKWKQYFPLYTMLIPGMVYLFINNYIPMPGIIVAFKNFNYQKGILGSEWNGFKNFIFLFKTNDALLILRNTVCYNIVFIILGTIMALAVSIMLNELTSQKAKKLYQIILLFPYLLSIVVVSYIVYGFLNPQSGFMNHLLLKWGKEPISWYSTPKYWPFILTFINIWKGFGYSSIMYYATLLGIDPTYYEAAIIDGATRWQKIRFVILPLLKPTVIILTLMSVSKILYSDFGLFYQVPLNSGPLINVTNTIDTYVYRGLMESNNIGMSAAAGLYQSVVGFVMLLAANWLVGKVDQENTLF